MTTSIDISHKSKNEVIRQTVSVLKKGGLVVFPSDTVYGLLVDATSEKGVERLIKFKNRPPGKAISIFVSDLKMLSHEVNIPLSKKDLISELLPGPFTLILESRHHISPKLESEKGTLGVRIPDYDLVADLVKAYEKPVTATSANLGGRHPHYSVESLLHQLPKHKQQLIDFIVDAGKLPRNKPSTVLDLTQDRHKILRHGDIVLHDSQTFISKTPAQTKKTGRFIMDMIVKKNHRKPVVCILKGDLGTGKTVMVKGMAEYFGIENIISPTFVVYYEYDIAGSRWPLVVSSYNKFFHVDLYNIQEEEEFKHLGLEDYLKEGNVMCIEWGEKLGNVYKTFVKKAHIVFIEINYVNENERKIVMRT